jgi:hypothetical protein
MVIRMHVKNKKSKILGLIISSLLILLIFSVLIPPATSVFVGPGTPDDNSVSKGTNVTFEGVNLTIRGHEKIVVNFLNFTIHDNDDDSIVAYIVFTVHGIESDDYPNDKLAVRMISSYNVNWYNPDYGYGYDENFGGEYGYTDFGYGYGTPGDSDITFLYSINYTTHKSGEFYGKLIVNSTYTGGYHNYSSDKSSTFTVKSSSSSGGGGGAFPSNSAPTADAGGPYSGIIEEAVDFIGSGTDSDGVIVGYRWDFTSDGTWDTDWSTSTTATHTYDTEGDYTVTLQVKDDFGATGSDTASVEISIEPPLDTDGDGISDDEDTDDDNDGLDDETEIELGSDPKDDTDVKTVTIGENTYHFVDTDGDDEIDTIYDPKTGEPILFTIEDDKIFFDTTGDGEPDYEYDIPSGQIAEYKEKKEKSEPFPIWIALLAIAIVAIIIIVALFKMGYLYVEEEKPGEKK